jgi:rhodanese-related sulfurtransferase
MRRTLLSLAMVMVAVSAAIAAPYKNIDSSQAKALIDKGGVFLLDVRTPDEYQQAHLQGAVLIPVDQVGKRFGEIPKERTVLVYCAVGSRSSAAAGILADKGYRNVYNMREGIVGWHRKGFPLSR